MGSEAWRAVKLEIVPDEPDELRAFKARRAAEAISEMRTLERLAELGITRREPPELGWGYNPPEPPDIVA